MSRGKDILWVGVGEVPSGQAGQHPPPAPSGLESSPCPQSVSAGSASGPVAASGPGCKENFSGWGFSLPIALPERKFHALRISRQSTLEVELAVKAMWAGHGGWEGRQSSRGL